MTRALEQALKHSLDCVHCGLCLPSCPTYESTLSEADSPRGRIVLMRALAEGKLEAQDPLLHAPLDRCLDCRACESACPSGVSYGRLLEDVRGALLRKGSKAAKATLTRVLLNRFLSSERGHDFAIAALAFAQNSGLLRIARALAPSKFRHALELLPKVPAARERRPIEAGVYEPIGKRRAEVGLFTGCMMDSLFGRVHEATLRALRIAGCRVHVPADQTCCGALHAHQGFRKEARELALQNMTAFPDRLDAVILNSAGCGSTMKEYAELDATLTPFAGKVKDASEFLAELDTLRPSSPQLRRAVYDDPCHLCHGQGIRNPPRELLARIPGLRLLPLEASEDCCGSAGIYMLTQQSLSRSILDRKLDAISKSGADLLITANPGCHLQIEAGLRQRGMHVEVLHLMELLARSV